MMGWCDMTKCKAQLLLQPHKTHDFSLLQPRKFASNSFCTFNKYRHFFNSLWLHRIFNGTCAEPVISSHGLHYSDLKLFPHQPLIYPSIQVPPGTGDSLPHQGNL